MKAILNIGDMQVYGNATLYGTRIDFIGHHFKPKRRLKTAPIDIATQRLKKGISTNLRLFQDGEISIGPLLTYGVTIDWQHTVCLTTSHNLLDMSKST